LQNRKGRSDADIVARDAASLPAWPWNLAVRLQHALLRNPNGEAASPLGRAIDAIAQAESVS
jgi:hypothetical protein